MQTGVTAYVRQMKKTSAVAYFRGTADWKGENWCRQRMPDNLKTTKMQFGGTFAY